MPWRGVLAYHWDDDTARENMAVLTLERSQTYRWRWPVPKHKQATVDRMLRRHLGREGGAG